MSGVVLAVLIASQTALAVGFEVHPSSVLVAQAGTFTEKGVGSPTVIWTSRSKQYLMFFESRIEDSTELCPGGRYAIGRAVSGDGLSWTVDPAPLIAPTPGTFYSCTAAHPKAVVDGSSVRVWFKGEQQSDACDTTTPQWGCARQTGVGHFSIPDRGAPVATITPAPVLNVTGFGFPSVTKLGDTWYMYLAKVPSIYVATSASPTGPFALDPVPVLEPGRTSWSEHRVFNPAISCRDDLIGIQMWMGGKRMGAGNVTEQTSLGDALVPNSTDVYVGAYPQLSWAGDALWRHWDVIRERNGKNVVVYFAEQDPNGRNRIGLAYSTPPPFSPDMFSGKTCAALEPVPVAADAEPKPLDGPAAGDSGMGDTGMGGVRGGCDTGGSRTLGFVALLPLLLLRRRSA